MKETNTTQTEQAKMKSIQDNLKRVSELETIVSKHSVGGDFEYTPTHVRVLFHDTWAGLNGCQVSLDKGKINALGLLIEKLDKLYNSSQQWRSSFQPIKSI